MEDKLFGMLVGVMLGDALGMPWERGVMAKTLNTNSNLFSGKLDVIATNFNRYTNQTKKTVIGQWSDDTEMTLELGYSLIEANKYDVDTTIKHYLWFANSCPFLGKNTREIFKGISTVRGYHQRIQRLNPNSEGNGSLMRASPLVIFKSTENILTDCRLSNPNPHNEWCSLQYHLILRNAIMGILIPFELPFDISSVTLTNDNKGWVMVPLLIYNEILNSNPANFSQVMKSIISYLGDTDTNMAIIGAIYGAYWGFNHIMQDKTTCENWQTLLKTDTKLGDYPRPEKYHPSQILSLAKGLAVLYQH